MSQPLPTGEFKWVYIENLKQEARELKKTIDMMVRNSNRGYGYVLEVDVKYPRELHDLHNDLPFMCEKIRVSEVKKLVPNLHDKKKYSCHLWHGSRGIILKNRKISINYWFLRPFTRSLGKMQILQT